MLRSIFIVLLAGLALLWLCSTPAMATSGEVHSFQALGDLRLVGNFYNGRGLPFTPNYGTTFSSNLYGLSSVYKGGEKEAGWSESNGTAMVLATMALSPNNRSCIHFPTYCNWSSAGLSFWGTAKSRGFSGDTNGIGIFDTAAGSTSTNIPELSTFYMFGTGFIGISFATVRRSRRIQKATRATISHVCP